MSIPTFHTHANGAVDVHLEGQFVGRIGWFHTSEFAEKQWRYTPKGQKTGGELFPTLEACKASLMSEYT